MGKIQCVSLKGNTNDNWEKIEKDLEKRNTYFERALLTEYKDIKLMLEYSDKDLQILNKAEIYSYVDKRKKVSRFIKWYKMAFEEDVSGKILNSKTKRELNNSIKKDLSNTFKNTENILKSNESEKRNMNITTKLNKKFNSMYNKKDEMINDKYLSPINDNASNRKDNNNNSKIIKKNGIEVDKNTKLYDLIVNSNEKPIKNKDSIKHLTTDKKFETRKNSFNRSITINNINQGISIMRTSNVVKNLDTLPTKTDSSNFENLSSKFKNLSKIDFESEKCERFLNKNSCLQYDQSKMINSENKNIRVDSLNKRKISDINSIKNNQYEDNTNEKLWIRETNIIDQTTNDSKITKNDNLLKPIEEKINNKEIKANDEKSDNDLLNDETMAARRKYSQSLLFSNTKTKKKFDVIINPNEEKTKNDVINNSSVNNLEEAKNFLKSSIICKGKKNDSSINSKNGENSKNHNSYISPLCNSGNSFIHNKNQLKINNQNIVNENDKISMTYFKTTNDYIKNRNEKMNENMLAFENENNINLLIKEKFQSKISSKNLFPAKRDNKDIFDLKEIDSIYNDEPLNITIEEQEELKTDILKLKDLIDSKSIYKLSNNNDFNNNNNKNLNTFNTLNTISNISLNDNTRESKKEYENFYCNKNNSIFDWENYFNNKFIENKLRNYYSKYKNKFNKKICKGPPETFRWISWIITAKIPENRNEDFYNKFLKKQLSSEILIQIKKDIGRTFPKSIKRKYFQNANLDLNLFRILKALAIKDSDVGYCQGMNFIVGFLLIVSNYNELEAFYMMLSLLNYTGENDFGIRGFFTLDFPLLILYVYMFQYFFAKKLPALKSHFYKLEIPDELWISKWIQTLFTIVLPYDAVKRVWDCILTNGLDFIISFSIAYLKFMEQDLIKQKDTIDIINFFKKLSPLRNEDEYCDLDDLDSEQENSLYLSNIEKLDINSQPNSIPNNNIKNQILESRKDENNSKFNIEDIIQTAFKLNLRKSEFESLKIQYEKISKKEINSLHSQNFTIRELFDYKITEISMNEEDDGDENIHSEFSDYAEEKLKNGTNKFNQIRRKICFNENDSPGKKIKNDVDHGSYFKENTEFEKFGINKHSKYFKKLTLTDKLKKTKIHLTEKLLENNVNNKIDGLSNKLFIDSETRDQKNLPSRKNIINFDLLIDLTSSNLNEESNPINLNNITNASIDEMITGHTDRIDNSKSLKVSFINNIRRSIDSKNMSSIVNKMNPPIIKDNTDFRSSFLDNIHNNLFK